MVKDAHKAGFIYLRPIVAELKQYDKNKKSGSYETISGKLCFGWPHYRSGQQDLFNNAGQERKFNTSDFHFVAAGHKHWFQNFTDDFATWVFFYGPIGGETHQF